MKKVLNIVKYTTFVLLAIVFSVTYGIGTALSDNSAEESYEWAEYYKSDLGYYDIDYK